jgi:hypothetical protein
MRRSIASPPSRISALGPLGFGRGWQGSEMSSALSSKRKRQPQPDVAAETLEIEGLF